MGNLLTKDLKYNDLEFLRNFNLKEIKKITKFFDFREIYVNLPLTLNSGCINNILGVKIDNYPEKKYVFSNLRIHPFFDIDYFKNFSLLNSKISAFFDIDASGSFSSLIVDPYSLNEDEKMELFKMFCSSIGNDTFDNFDFFSNDLNSNIKDLKIFSDTYHLLNGAKNDEPISFADFYSQMKTDIDFENIIEISIYNALTGYYKLKNIEPEDLTITIYGFGTRPFYLAKLLKKEKFSIVGIMTHMGSFYDPYGIDLEDFYNDYVSGFISKEEKRYKKIDSYTFRNIRSNVVIFFTDSVGDSIIDKINTEIIIEGRKMIFSEDDSKKLLERKIDFIPSEIACSGDLLLFKILTSKNLNRKINDYIKINIQDGLEYIFSKKDRMDVKSVIFNRCVENILENI